ncbi:hypothetical protein SBFV3_gp51 [Sulfolobales Beppu filamentous virus 3]|uniref:Uncharacterized protein n=1 Tax=Sulfolobales Beppu filamentous virus 3 TaxID=2493124 RepID=A0A3Q8Q403_9VIRU|nr:hypothetical protein HOU83_gp51 [Sulfolobales Beppu filamentous virus 3]AZI75886.1 hypothetical protein SBFV3_gp51 [Sulfolobales Beppu filamentous virus 3]
MDMSNEIGIDVQYTTSKKIYVERINIQNNTITVKIRFTAKVYINVSEKYSELINDKELEYEREITRLIDIDNYDNAEKIMEKIYDDIAETEKRFTMRVQKLKEILKQLFNYSVKHE